MHKLDSPGFRLGFATVVFFTGIAGDFWRNLIFWQGYGVIVVIIWAISIRMLVHNRHRFRIGSLPYPLLAFLVLAILSISWSFYPGFTALGAMVQLLTTAAAIVVAVSLTWPELLTVLGWTFRLVLGLSFLFEFIVSVFVRHPIYPVWIAPREHPAKLLYWSRDLLFETGKIQGIVGNSSLLAMAAMLGLVVFAIQLASRSVRRSWGFFWLVLAVLTIVITRSATIYVAVIVVALIAGSAVLVRRAPTPRKRAHTYAVLASSAVLMLVVGLALRTPLFRLLGKSSDATGRAEIWHEVVQLAQQRPVGGWGWLSYWIVWISPFDTFKKVGGVQPPHAHDAWLDVWLQVGIVGLIIFVALVLATLVRCWLLSVDRIVTTPGQAGTYSWLALLPLLMLSAQLVQSVAESRILLEGGWILLVVWAVKTKMDPLLDSPDAVQSLVAARRHG